MDRIYFEILGCPQGKARAKVSTMGGFARAYTPEKTVMYENYVKTIYLNKYKQTTSFHADIPLKVTITAVYEIPKSFSVKKRKDAIQGNLRPLVKPDSDNVAKIICDALNQLAYHDDKQITDLTVKKFYGEQPRVEVQVEPIKQNKSEVING